MVIHQALVRFVILKKSADGDGLAAVLARTLLTDYQVFCSNYYFIIYAYYFCVDQICSWLLT